MKEFKNLNNLRDMNIYFNKNSDIFKLIDFIEDTKEVKNNLSQDTNYLIDLDVYDSIHIEGNTLTREEITALLEGAITVREKPLKEYLEASNYNSALEIIKYTLTDKLLKINEDFIKYIHKIVMGSILHYEEVGQYRKVPVYIRKSAYIPPSAEEVSELMKDLCYTYNNDYEEYDGFTHIIRFFYKFESIHPFVDGNGRTGRLLMNYLLLKNGYNFLWVDSSRREEYLRCFSSFDNCLDFHVKQYIRSLVQSRSLKVCPLCKGLIKKDRCSGENCNFSSIIL